MGIIKLNKLIGITTEEVHNTLIPFIRKLKDEEILTICLYFMSDLPDNEHHLSKIASNLETIGCFYFKEDNFVRLRTLFNLETKKVNDKELNYNNRLWKHIAIGTSRSGLWRNTDVGNSFAEKILKKHNIDILIEHRKTP